MPGAVPRTSTFALTNATLPYTLKLANNVLKAAVSNDDGLKAGVNTYAGKLTYEAVALSQAESTRRWINAFLKTGSAPFLPVWF
jgi:alanine dehydrogenase